LFSVLSSFVALMLFELVLMLPDLIYFWISICCFVF
jgi:hypothetical protein